MQASSGEKKKKLFILVVPLITSAPNGYLLMLRVYNKREKRHDVASFLRVHKGT